MKRLMVFTLSILIALAGSAFAQQRRPGGPPPGAGFSGPGRGNSNALAVYLGLTTEQKAAWETIQSETREAARSLHEQERSLAEQLEAATDATTIGGIVLQLRALQTQIEAARDAGEARFSAMLISDQQAKFAAFQAATQFLRQRGPGGPPPHPRQ
ncbi:MAG: Spy/CpxP family protein refolding chaperone [Acidobacteriota bacterium]|nr:Spy/CpxP family protein refolding chaperone [Acidobacteriota bacterium]